MQYYVLAVVVTAIATFVVIKGIDRLRQWDAEKAAKDILERANRDAANKLKEAELSIKEAEIGRKAEIEKQLEKSRSEIRERERALDKRQEMQEQQGEDLRKQERIAETTQRKAAERLEELNRKREDLDKSLDQQKQATLASPISKVVPREVSVTKSQSALMMGCPGRSMR